MSAPLWTSDAIAAATGGVASAPFAVSGVTFDSREVGPGDLFVALKGEHTDGHRYVEQALTQGATGLIVSEPRPGTPHVQVADTQAALETLGRAARARLAPTACVVGVTGSAGKTSVKQALFDTFMRAGRAHASVKSYNNHTGVPLSLARMPADTERAVFEMGMNHAGEIAALTAQVRPDVALITTIAPAHIENFPDGEAGIADAKAEIFLGLERGGRAILPFDSPYYARLRAAVNAGGHQVIGFGLGERAQVRGIELMEGSDGSSFTVEIGGKQMRARIGMPGRHHVLNALAVIATAQAAGVNPALAIETLATASALPGRGQRLTIRVRGGGEATILDESYNANPASMAAALGVLADATAPRKIAVLGGMRELGARAPVYHAALVPALIDAGVAHAVLVGEETRPIAERFAAATWTADWHAALEAARATIRAGDLVLVKGSNGIGLGNLVAALTIMED